MTLNQKPQNAVQGTTTLFLAPTFVVRFNPVTGHLDAVATAPKPVVAPASLPECG